MNPKESATKIYFPHLDVLRFVAAFMIVILHSYIAYTGWFGNIGFMTGGTFTTLTKTGVALDHLIQGFHIGVDIFFLISGFLITYILIEEKKLNHKINIKNFMIRRSLRIWPLYFGLIAISPLLVKWMNDPNPDYIYNLLFLNNFHTMTTKIWAYPFSHFWSICIEEHFYLVWPFIIAFIPVKKLPLVFSILLAGSIGYQIYISFTSANAILDLYLNTLCRIDVLIIGACGALIYSKKPITVKLHPLLNFALFIILIFLLSFDPFAHWGNPISAIVKKYSIIGIITVLLLNYNFNPNFKFHFRPKSIIHYLGKVSYGIYMISNILLPIIVKKIMWVLGSSNMYLFFGLVFGLSILIPILSYELFEKRFQKLSGRFQVIKTER